MNPGNSVEWEALPTVAMAEELTARYRYLTANEAEWLRGLAIFDRRLGWQVMGYRSAAAWLARTMGMTMVTAREKLRVARVLTDGLPLVGQALAEGRISYTQARTLCLLPEADGTVEASLVTAAEAGASAARSRPWCAEPGTSSTRMALTGTARRTSTAGACS